MVENAPSISEAVESIAGPGCRIESKRSVSGGDINRTSILNVSGGISLFVKENRSDLAPMFAAEAAGLTELSTGGSDTPPVPAPLACGRDGKSSFLIMEFIESGRISSGSAFGTALAELHRTRRHQSSGLDMDNWIGSTPQMNHRMDSWHGFFAEQRLGFQWRLARKNGYGDSKTENAMMALLRRLPDLIPDLESGGASLLHGDLWGGNWIAGTDSRAYLIDPAVYYGHREADVAMTQLFGGFPAGFLDGYISTWQLESGFSERKDLYNLYHMLNHLNLFGLSYWGTVRSIILRYS